MLQLVCLLKSARKCFKELTAKLPWRCYFIQAVLSHCGSISLQFLSDSFAHLFASCWFKPSMVPLSGAEGQEPGAMGGADLSIWDVLGLYLCSQQ